MNPINPLISVIVPVYKVEKYLPQCVDSILAQTYRNLEIILVDDGSPDGCPKICDEYAKKDSRVRVIHQKNAGVSAARNAGLDCAQGEYIGFVDSDDFIAPEMFEALLSLIKKYHVSISMCSITVHKLIKNKNLSFSQNRKKQEGIITSDKAIQKLIKPGEDIFPGAKILLGALWNNLFSADLFESSPTIRLDTDIFYGEDTLAIIQCMRKVQTMAYTTQPYYDYRAHPDSATRCGFSKKLLTKLLSIRKIIDLLTPDLSSVGKATYAEIASSILCLAYASKQKDYIPLLKKERRKYAREFRRQHKNFPPKSRIRFWGTGVCPFLFCRLWNLLKAMRPRRDVSG